MVLRGTISPSREGERQGDKALGRGIGALCVRIPAETATATPTALGDPFWPITVLQQAIVGSPNPGLGSDCCETETAAALPPKTQRFAGSTPTNEEHEARLAFPPSKMAPLPTRHTLSYREIGLIIHSHTQWFCIQSPRP